MWPLLKRILRVAEQKELLWIRPSTSIELINIDEDLLIQNILKNRMKQLKAPLYICVEYCRMSSSMLIH